MINKDANGICESVGGKNSNEFFEDVESSKRERLFMEFNTLSVVYNKPSETFLKD